MSHFLGFLLGKEFFRNTEVFRSPRAYAKGKALIWMRVEILQKPNQIALIIKGVKDFFQSHLRVKRSQIKYYYLVYDLQEF